MIDQSQVSIVIPHLGETKEQEYSFDECYASLRESTPEIRIVVAKNGGACPHLRDVRVVSQGQCKAVNAAVAITNTPWIIVSNDDMVFSPGWFEKLTQWETSQCISARLVEPRSGAPTFLEYFCGGAGGDFDKQKWLEFAKKYISSELIQTGFNLPFLISKELWNLIEGYDINYDEWGSNSDSDLEYKIRLAGVQPYQNTNCIVYHFFQTSGTFNPEN